MRCKIHPAVGLYEDILETKGFCPKCDKWYDLDKEDNKDVSMS